MTATEIRRDRDQIALALALIAVLKKRVEEVEDQTRAEGLAAMKVGARDVAELPDGTKIGGVTHAKGKAAKPYVKDERAFLAWMQANQPHNVETITRVRPAATQVILDANGTSVDPQTGELTDVPGIDWSQEGASHLTVTPDKDAVAAVMRAVAAGQITLPDLLQLEAAS